MSRVDIISSRLISQDLLLGERDDWRRTVLRDITSRIGSQADFPCVFAKNAFRKQALKFLFVSENTDCAMRDLATGISEYVQLSRSWTGELDTAYPLIVAFSHDVVQTDTVEGYHKFGWHVLQKLHELDRSEWPHDVAQDPASPAWSMCFNGMPLFFNMSLPAHRTRKSRNLGEHFLFVVNPRERFDIVAGNTPAGRKMRSNIRRRIAAYDGSSHALQLSAFGVNGLEWWQYGLIDHNIERTDKCPFVFKK